MIASDVMTTSILSVAPSTPVREVARFLTEHKISAVPVIRDDGQAVGVISEGDLIHRVELGTADDGAKGRSWWLGLLRDPGEEARQYVKTHGVVAGDVMTRGVIAVPMNASLTEVTNILDRRRIRRVFVVENGRIVGVITRSDLVRALARLDEPLSQWRDDHEIRQEIELEIRANRWTPGSRIEVTVHNGRVNLAGVVESVAQREGLHILAQRIAGVREVMDELIVRPRHMTRTAASF